MLDNKGQTGLEVALVLIIIGGITALSLKEIGNEEQRAKWEIKEGDSELVQIKKRLNLKGYKIVVDQSYDDSDVKVMKKFQSDLGLGADGVIGPKTLEALDLLKEWNQKDEEAEKADVDHREGGLDKGNYFSEREENIMIQVSLAKLGFYTGAFDGWFGEGTVEAVKKYQVSIGLKPDGIVGDRTWDILVGNINDPLEPEEDEPDDDSEDEDSDSNDDDSESD